MQGKSIMVIIGTSGVGKTTIGQRIAKELSIPFVDADDHHPEQNIAKMKAGIPLDDEDRAPWLAILNSLIIKAEQQSGIILACSALKEKYRQQLANNISNEIAWIVLTGDKDLILERMQRRNHFFKPEMLQSQFDSWELPEYGHHINSRNTPQEIVKQIIEQINQ